MKVYITGNNSFISKHYSNYFNNKSNKVFFYTRNSNLNEILKINPDIIIHCAAEIYDSSKMVESNILLTQQILDITKNINYKRFVYIGSSSEYGIKNLPIKETMVLEPNTMYAATKACGTLLCQAHSLTYNKPIFCFRPFSVYGPLEKQHRLFPVVFDHMENDTAFELSPSPVHDWIYINDFINATLHIIENYSNVLFDIVNIGTGKQYSNLDVIKCFEKTFQKSLNYAITKNQTKVHDTSKMWCSDIDKLKNYYKFNYQYDLQAGLLDYYDKRTKQKAFRN